ncbi:39S ribosomal protein L50, mitochondrial isoform X2 [Fopius arisanus]|uniref:Large ribosomal subunit protein mL50 n=1 Tax=Fopius arisanus TaxID=64838 RepID=A0A9R1U855_9HYME|nr:PREDICTED: 39S ribosomal protein L50, mitochondrial isoform X2 [Fopius arisanus]
MSVRVDGVRHKRGEPPLPPRSTIKWKLQWDETSLGSRGFLRPLKPYEPPADASQRLDMVCRGQGLSPADSTRIDNLLKRFDFFVACEKEFNYGIPSSRLYTMETIGDVRQFYKTPIVAALPFDLVRKTELPKNLHIQYEYHRFHPATDTKFNGKTAFPYSSTIVTGLKYKKKYKGHKQKNPFEDTYE